MTTPEVPHIPADFDGHTLEELSDYLDRGREPLDPSIESSASCRIALEALERVRALAPAVLDVDAQADPPRATWMTDVLASISMEAHAGRDIPLLPPDAASTLVITEGALRGLIREITDGVGGLLAGRVRIDGDLDQAGALVTITIDVNMVYGVPLHQSIDRLRAEVTDELRAHANLTVDAVHVVVRGVSEPDASDEREHAE